MKILGKLITPLLLASCAVLSAQALAAGAKPEVARKILDSLSEARPDLEYSEVGLSPIPGLYTVQIVGGPRLYVTENGKHFVAGELFAVEGGQFVNAEEQERAGERLKLMAGIDKKDQIVFSPQGETKAVVHVFTDVDCGYCQKLHQEMDQINAFGIEVRYLAFPRAGISSASADKLATAWCADDPRATMTRLKRREAVPIKTCGAHPVAEHHRLGQLVGVNGTPNMVTEDGHMIGGYLPAEQLAQRLGITN